MGCCMVHRVWLMTSSVLKSRRGRCAVCVCVLGVCLYDGQRLVIGDGYRGSASGWNWACDVT